MYWRKWLHIELLFHITILQPIDQTNSARLLTLTPSLLRLPDGLTAQQVEKGPVSGSRGSWEDQNSGRAKEKRAHSRKTIKLKSPFLAHLTPLVFTSLTSFSNIAQTSRKHQRYRMGHRSESWSSFFLQVLFLNAMVYLVYKMELCPVFLPKNNFWKFKKPFAFAYMYL